MSESGGSFPPNVLSSQFQSRYAHFNKDSSRPDWWQRMQRQKQKQRQRQRPCKMWNVGDFDNLKEEKSQRKGRGEFGSKKKVFFSYI